MAQKSNNSNKKNNIKRFPTNNKSNKNVKNINSNIRAIKPTPRAKPNITTVKNRQVVRPVVNKPIQTTKKTIQKTTQQTKNISKINVNNRKSQNIMDINKVRYSTNNLKKKSNNLKLARESAKKRALERNNKQVKRKTKKRHNILVARLVTFFIFSLTISYFGISIFKSLNREPIKFATIGYGTIDNQKTARGVIIRDETVYKANKAGTLEFYESENEKVKRGDTVASIKDQVAIKDTQVELEQINDKILEIQKNREELSLFSEEAKRVDNQIQNVLENGAYQFTQNDISAIYELRTNVQKKIDIRNQMLLSETGGSIKELSSMKSNKEQQINSNTQNLFVNESGILSYHIDGLEEQFKIENIDKLTPEQIKMEDNKKEEVYNVKMQVTEGEPIFKIIESNEFYIASYIKTEYISNWKEGDIKNIYINDSGKYQPQEVKVEKILLEDKESYVLMKSNKNMLNFIDERIVIFEINKPKEGIKINNTAIAEKNLLKVPTSYIVDGIITKKTENGTKKVIVEDAEVNEAEGITYVPIKFGEIGIGDIILNPTTNTEYALKDVYTSKGIYVVNSGVYEFKKINLENSVSNQDFTILDPKLNPNIKIYDRFIPDQKSILKEEPIYN